MGTIIRSIETAKPVLNTGIVDLSAKAAKLCLRRSGLKSKDIGVLISTGVYNESHLREPSIASLIQKKIEPIVHIGKRDIIEDGGTFSFDMHNGGGGGLNALQVIDGFIQSGKIINGLVIAADITPKFGITENYTYDSGAAAILLSGGEGTSGFQTHYSETFPEFSDDFKSVISWKSDEFVFSIQQKESYFQNCVACAEGAIGRFLEKENLLYKDIDLIITSQSPKGFAEKLSEKTGTEKMLMLDNTDHFYSPGIFMSLKEVMNTGLFQSKRTILFVSVGAGITVSISLYIN